MGCLVDRARAAHVCKRRLILEVVSDDTVRSGSFGRSRNLAKLVWIVDHRFGVLLVAWEESCPQISMWLFSLASFESKGCCRLGSEDRVGSCWHRVWAKTSHGKSLGMLESKLTSNNRREKTHYIIIKPLELEIITLGKAPLHPFTITAMA